MLTEELARLAASSAAPSTAVEAARVVVVHDVAVALAARPLVGSMLAAPAGEGPCTDLATGRTVDPASAVERNAQMVHALTQDDTLLTAMTHVGATCLPLLLALGEQEDVTVGDLLQGLCVGFAAAEVVGAPVAARLSGRGVRPTPVVGPVAAVTAAARMLGWSQDRLRIALGRVASTAFGTGQAWIDGSQDWLFQVSAAGVLALSAARSSAQPWDPALDPFWGRAGTFTVLGASPAGGPATDHDPIVAVTRARLKRFPVCACNQVPLVLVRAAMSASHEVAAVTAHLAPPEADYPGVAHAGDLASWSTRLMSLPYALAVMASTGDFTVADLRSSTASADLVDRMQVVADPDLEIGHYRLDVTAGDGTSCTLDGEVATVGRPERAELAHAAGGVAGRDRVDDLLAILDDPAAPVRSLLGSIREAT